LKGLDIEEIIRDVSNSAKPEVYKPRCGKANGSMKYYSGDQLNYIKSISAVNKYLRRFGYLKCSKFVNPSGILTDDESEELFYDSYDHWLRGFNSKMLGACLKFRDDFPEMKVKCSKVGTIINNPDEIDKYKAKRHRGWRVHRENVRHIMRQQITSAEQETLIK
jgi:hypothetical protein